jgi:membrane protein
MNDAAAFFRHAYGAIARVFPGCSMIAQAIAFNLFVAFFPTLLIVVGLASSRIGGRTNLLDLITDFTHFLPPGSQQIVSEFLVKRGPEAWKILVLGWAGTLLAGSQVMKLLMEGIHIIYGDEEKPGFLHRQLRGLVLLLLTITPLLAAAILGVFGRPLRRWIMDEFGTTAPIHSFWLFFFPLAAMFLALLALTAIYRFARPGEESFRNVLPGATVATLLWWCTDALFGIYVRKVPYSFVYGGLAAVIGLLVWMNISALIIFLGAAWNAEQAEARRQARR